MDNNTYQPVAINTQAEIKHALKDAEFASAYAALEDEFYLLDALLKARLAAGLTQDQVAARMGVKQSSLARIEASLGNQKHSPSLATLRKYANALGKRLVLSFE